MKITYADDPGEMCIQIYNDQHEREWPEGDFPDGWGLFNFPLFLEVIKDKAATSKMIAVLIELASRVEGERHVVDTTFDSLANKCGVSRGTVLRAIKFFERHNVIMRISRPHTRLKFLVSSKFITRQLVYVGQRNDTDEEFDYGWE